MISTQDTTRTSTLRRIVAAMTASAALLFTGTAFLSPTDVAEAGVVTPTLTQVSSSAHAAYLRDER